MIRKISGIQTTEITSALYSGYHFIRRFQLEVDGSWYPEIPGDEINPPEREKFEIFAVRIKINDEWVGFKPDDYASLEEEILESIEEKV